MNSPFESDPDQQLSHYTGRSRVRRCKLERLLGIYTSDELRGPLVGPEVARDVTPAALRRGGVIYEQDEPDELKSRGVRVCIPGRRGRHHPIRHNRRLHKKRCRIENACARLKDWRGIAMRYTRRGDLCLSASDRAATLILWLR